MSSMKLDRNLEEKSTEELTARLEEERGRKKLFFILTIVTGVLLVIGVLLMVFTSLNSPLIGIVCFALFIVCFMLFAYSRQNIAELENLLK